MRKSGLTRGSPNLVVLCLRKGVSLRKIKFLQKDTFGKALGYRCGLGRRALCSYFRCGTVGAGREHDTCPRAKESRCIGFGRGNAEGHVVTSVDSVHVSGGHWLLIYGINTSNPKNSTPTFLTPFIPYMVSLSRYSNFPRGQTSHCPITNSKESQIV
ncbi:hypothetical protein L3X38_008825 [Prunus dulcis]|uniref:Uncharacterized protein n=1 Tax=Prunus dulcis TaxID=3755 RepID=A0AAD4ZX68_PRUDU|nr:hypothetical protein L3X38_008825 [Prunus dulcis]